jgi:hypothetical protein
MNWSQDYTVKSNARRAARKAGVGVTKIMCFVKAGKKLYHFPLRGGAAARPAKPVGPVAKVIPKGTATKPVGAAKRRPGAKHSQVAAMLRRPYGASINEVVAITGWKRHTARARISVNVSKLLSRDEVIERRSEDGVSHYAIVKSKQLDLPIGKAA